MDVLLCPDCKAIVIAQEEAARRVSQKRAVKMAVAATAQVKQAYADAWKFMIKHHPFYGSFLCTTEVRWTERVPVAGVDGQYLYLNPITCAKLTRKNWRFLLAHEVQHLAHLHSFRQRKRHPFIWNMACDYCINLLLATEDDFILMSDVLYNQAYNNMSPEQIYDILIKNAKVMKMAKDSESNDEGDAQGGDQSEDDGNCPECGQNDWHPAGPDHIQCGQCGHTERNDQEGSSCGKEEGKQTRTIKIDHFHGDVMPVSEHLTKLDREAIEVRARQMAYQAAFMARTMGKDTTTTASIIQGMEAPTDWVLQMNSFVDNVIEKDDYTWARPRRRYVPWNIYLPDMGGTRPPKRLAVVLDVSGSINEATLTRFLDELGGVIQANSNVSFKMFTVDTRIHDTRTVGAEDIPLEFDISNAGGGTDFRPAFEAIEQSDEELPCGLIYFTDLECDSYSPEPDFPVLWLNFGRPMAEYSEWRGEGPPYGEVVDMQPRRRI